MNFLKHMFSGRQIKALLRKDVIVRLRQPWMIVLQIIWPIAIFLSLYIFRHRFQSQQIKDCQFPTRLLPSNNNLLPFFHSYICTIENQCLDIDNYEDYTTFNEAPLKPILNIVQTFLNEDKLYNAIYELPIKKNFVSAVTTIATHSKFSYMESNIQDIMRRYPQIQKMVGPNFDIKKLFADSMTFSRSGNIICGRPFPRNDNIRFVNDILETEDFSNINDDELDAMPTKYCKKLYLDVTSTNNGKITWSAIKRIIQGKIIYGPNTNDVNEIMKFANTTYEDMRRLQDLAKSLNTILIKLRLDDEFKNGFKKLLDLAKSPFIQMTFGGSIDLNMIEMVMNSLMNDQTIFDIIETVSNILECFSVDRFITVNTENELKTIAHELDKKNLYYAGIYFNETNTKNIIYTIRVEPDNTPVTLETQNRFWFPGPDASMALDLKYHRGFVQIKHSIDLGIIKYKKNLKNLHDKELKKNQTSSSSSSGSKNQKDDNKEDDWWIELDNDDNENETSTSVNTENDLILTTLPSIIHDEVTSWNNGTTSSTTDSIQQNQTNSEDEIKMITTITTDPNLESIGTSTPNEEKILFREKRAPQFEGLLGLLFGGNDKKDDIDNKINVNDVQVYTKQFPYPSYIRDDFKNGLYLAQAVQMAFFIALLIQIATSIRYRIWMKESKNTMLMRSMGLKSSSEILAWITTTFIEIIFVLLIACIILYSGGILQYSGFLFLFLFLTVFGLCMISFCFLCSTIFSSASVGCVSSVILFLMTFMPYIIIICLDTKLPNCIMFIINLSFSTPFCYAWDYIMRLELQGIGITFDNAFENGFNNEFAYAFGMICLDLILYTVIGFIIDRMRNDEFKFHSVTREDLDINIGATIENASKIYDDMKIAVSNIALTFPKNQITCLLGRNGAGKSTIIKMLTGQIKPTSGKIVLSQALADQNQSDRIGLCSQDNILIPNLTAREHLEMYAKIKLKHGIHLEVMRIMKNLNFGKYENYEACNLSGGYQRRLCVAIAFIGSPNVVILDEPCSGVDTKARKCLWELIEILKIGRAVILATHYLDEAEYLSDSVIILNEGKIIAKHSPDTLKSLFTKSFEINIKLNSENGGIENQIYDEIKTNLNKYLDTYNILETSNDHIKLSIPYNHNINNDGNCVNDDNNEKHKPIDLIESLEQLQNDNKIYDIKISSKNLEEIFNNLNEKCELNDCNNIIKNFYDNKLNDNDKIISISSSSTATIDTTTTETETGTRNNISRYEIIKILLWKRLIHFKRNYRLLLSILILPVIFEIIAMGFMQLRPGGEYDNKLNLSKVGLYPNSVEFLQLTNGTKYINETFDLLKNDCINCVNMNFKNSNDVFKWILYTNDIYPIGRYGGLTFNSTYAIVWYYNKGYHSMLAWLNDLNTHFLQAEMNDTEYTISTFNEPIKLGEREITYSSILQQVSDAGVSLIILIAFSLVVAGASVYIVNERVNGEKLQQKLCGVDYQTYWGVAFFWDFLILLIAVLLCVLVFECFQIPVYVAKSNLSGICLLLILYGFALIPAIHIAEKLFSEASFANMAIFCMNVVIALTTITIIIMIDILGETDESVKWRNILNRAFLIFPQHALSDGLIEICKNFIVSEVFQRFDIDSYKSPITSNLLWPHFISLIILGFIFMGINYAIECGLFKNILKKILLNRNDTNYELKIVSIQNSLKYNEKYRQHSNGFMGTIHGNNEDGDDGVTEAASVVNGNNNENFIKNDNHNYTLKVENLYKSYKKNDYAVKNVSFHVNKGECFGLLGNNGAGKSTIFKILSGQLSPTSGIISYRKNGISYCPQTNALDPLLTVKEIIEFYGRLRRIDDIDNLISTTLKSFHLDSYKNILVKNLSGGNRRKLNVAISCIGNVNLILMDEPTSDMDPITRSLVYQQIIKLINENKSILMTSHTISEIDKICHRIAIIKDGKLINTGTPEQLNKKYGGYYTVTMFYDNKINTQQFEMDLKKEFPECKDIQFHAYSIKFVIQVGSKSNIIKNNEIITNDYNNFVNNSNSNDHNDNEKSDKIKKNSKILSLSDLFKNLNIFCYHQYKNNQLNIKYTIVCCRLDKIFEKILDSSEFNNGSYTHRNYIQTETALT